MKEVAVRKFHRTLGIIVVWFLAVQGLTGLILAALALTPGSPDFYNLLTTIHYGGNPLGSFYRILLALGTLTQGISGIIIFFLIRARTRKV